MNEKKISLEGNPPPVRPAKFDLWQAWWEDSPTWEGYGFYRAENDADLETAQLHAAYDYVASEYAWHPDDDEDERPDLNLSWDFEYYRWNLLEDGKATGVTLSRVRIWEAGDQPVRSARSASGTV